MMARVLLGLAAVGACCALAFGQAQPVYVDLSKAVNASLEDDGVAGNGQGGWSDEGINDMLIYPPVPAGEVVRNGYRFRLLDGKDTGGRSVIMLKGEKLPDRPASASVDVPKARGRYVYFLQNCVKQVGATGDVVATYKVGYADGASAEIPVRLGREILPWWSAQWYDNAGAGAWPVFMGRNVYSMKWKRYVGVWAMQWENPHPDKEIVRIDLASAGKSVPVIFAVTITADDYYKGPDVKKDYQRPDDVPRDFFTAKTALENQRLFAEMGRQGHVQGLRRVELLRPDVLAVTVDAGLGSIGGGPGEDVAAFFQKSDRFRVSSQTDPAFKSGKAPGKIGRFSYEYWNGDVGPFPQCMLYWHTYYLFLDAPLHSGNTYTVSIRDMATTAPVTVGSAPAGQALRTSEPFTYDEHTTPTPAIKVNQVAYSAAASRRYAYLGYWAGDAGKIDYAAMKTFRVIDEKTGQAAMTGELKLRQADDPMAGEDVYEMDLSALKSGGYHIEVAGLGRSVTFGVGGSGMADLYRQTHRAFFHQRCGMALEKAFTDFPRPACHQEVYESGFLVGNPAAGAKPGEKIRTFRGGYHDAADFDVFTYHLRATAQALAAYEAFADKFKDGDLKLPESGNQIPDVLDEAQWALGSYLETQREDGAVPLGRGNDQDAIRDWEREHKGARPAFGLFPPTTTSSAEYAAVAAQFARLIAPFDAKRSQQYAASAEKALAWALANPAEGAGEGGAGCFLAWAASELYAATGKAPFHDTFKRLCADGAFTKVHWKLAAAVPTFTWSYITCKRETDEKLLAQLRTDLVRRADEVVKQTDHPAYRMGGGVRGRGLGWGNGNGGGHYADPCLRAYLLTKDRKYLDAASLNADFQLGANPLSKTFITGMGARPPEHPQISPLLYTGPNKTGLTVKGITVYGLADVKPAWYPQEVPAWRKWRDLGNGGAEVCSEFTITETIGASAMLYAMLEALEP